MAKTGVRKRMATSKPTVAVRSLFRHTSIAQARHKGSEHRLAGRFGGLLRLVPESRPSLGSCFDRREFNSARFESLGRQPASHRLGKGAGGILGGSQDLIDLTTLQCRQCGICLQIGVMLRQKSIKGVRSEFSPVFVFVSVARHRQSILIVLALWLLLPWSPASMLGAPRRTRLSSIPKGFFSITGW
jgi:hypothetical protein